MPKLKLLFNACTIYDEIGNRAVSVQSSPVNLHINKGRESGCEVQSSGECTVIRSQKRNAKGRFTKMTPDVDGSFLYAGDVIVTKKHVFLVMNREAGDQKRAAYEEDVPSYYKDKFPRELKLREISTKSPDQMDKYLRKVGHSLA